MTVSGLPEEIEPAMMDLERGIRRLVGMVSTDTRFWTVQRDVMETYRQMIALRTKAITWNMARADYR